jgi:hypothetical protein
MSFTHVVTTNVCYSQRKVKVTLMSYHVCVLESFMLQFLMNGNWFYMNEMFLWMDTVSIMKDEGTYF